MGCVVNTWTRLLLEYATGYNTGSVDPADEQLQRDFVGEAFCSWRSLVIKAHPVNVKYVNSSSGAPTGSNNVSEVGRFELMAGMDKKCLKEELTTFDRAVILVREPYAAIFAEYIRQWSHTHAGFVYASTFLANLQDWEESSLQMAREYDSFYQDSLVPMLKTMNRTKYLVVKFEDLLNKSTQIDTLYSIVRFISAETAVGVSLERLVCAFVQADSPSVHRAYSEDRANVSLAYRDARHADKLWPHLQAFSDFAGYRKHAI